MPSSFSPIVDGQTIIISDRISNLPDEILCDILSFLPTNYAMATSILSKRYVSNIYFDDRLFNRNYTRVFHSCMYKVLKVLRSKRIHSFSIKNTNGGFSCFNDYDVEEWIRDAFRLKVEQLELSNVCTYFDVLTCPRILYTGATIVQLKLSVSNALENLPSTIFFPNLKILKYVVLYRWDDERFKKLIGGCPVLENLYVKNESWSGMDVCSISSSSLTRLTLIEKSHNDEATTKLELDVPNLQYIQIKGKFDKFSVMGRLYSVIEAGLDLLSSIPNFGRDIIPGIFEKFSNVKTFTLPSSTLKALNFAPIDTFDIFQNITHLKIKAELCNWHLLPYILERSTNLQVLLFTKGTYSQRKIQERYCHEPRNVPKCLDSSLRQISIHGYQGLDDEIQMVQYFLENAQVLSRIEIGVSLGKKSQLYHQIQTLHKAAMTCEVVFLS